MRGDGLRATVINGPNMGGKSCYMRQVRLQKADADIFLRIQYAARACRLLASRSPVLRPAGFVLCALMPDQAQTAGSSIDLASTRLHGMHGKTMTALTSQSSLFNTLHDSNVILGALADNNRVGVLEQGSTAISCMHSLYHNGHAQQRVQQQCRCNMPRG
jgi:hypothetical protein